MAQEAKPVVHLSQRWQFYALVHMLDTVHRQETGPQIAPDGHGSKLSLCVCVCVCVCVCNSG